MTQVGHVKDLATAFVKCLGNKKAYNQIYNVAGEGWHLAFVCGNCLKALEGTFCLRLKVLGVEAASS